MTRYIRNRACRCPRCKIRNLTGPAILVTVGVLLLVQEYWYFYLGRTWPVLLIVVGLLFISAQNASTEGHVQPWWASGGPEEESKEKNPYQNDREPQVKL